MSIVSVVAGVELILIGQKGTVWLSASLEHLASSAAVTSDVVSGTDEVSASW